MQILFEIALKSLIVAALTLGLLQLMKSRSAAERSWVAHIGLLALVIVALAPLVLPTWNIEGPALLNRADSAAPVSQGAPAVPVPPSTAAVAPVVHHAAATPSTRTLVFIDPECIPAASTPGIDCTRRNSSSV